MTQKQDLLSQDILNFFNENINSLSRSKQFHFNSRMFLWTWEEIYKERLNSLQDILLSDLTESLEKTKRLEPEYPKKFIELRKPAIEKYPWITRYDVVLFKWLFLKTIFGKNIRETIFKTISKSDLQEKAATLLSDGKSLTLLSTFGINFLYITREILQNRNLFLPKNLLEIAKKNHTNLKEHVGLELYFFTHCIIGESIFYKRKIRNNIATYKKMLSLAENLLEKYFESISIDNKVEFLVAAKICNFHSRLFEKIQSECQNNFSISTGFIREPRKSLEKQNISNSEHRNVLYIMSNISPYFQATKKI